MGDKARGFYNKFTILREDGSDRPGDKHENCSYFVLDLTHDKYAWPALAAYENACIDEYPLLAADLRRKRIATVGLAAIEFRDQELLAARRAGAIEALEAVGCLCGEPESAVHESYCPLYHAAELWKEGK